MKIRVFLAVLIGTAFVVTMVTLAAAAEPSGRWIHVRVLDKGVKQESVKVNLPVSILESMAGTIEADNLKDGRIQLGDSGLTATQLRAMWQALQSAGDTEFVTVQSDDETVRVAKSGNYLIAKVQGARNGESSGDKVDVKVPLKVVDALLDAPEGELNFRAALKALTEQDSGDLVLVQDRTSHVRIWIDGRSSTED